MDIINVLNVVKEKEKESNRSYIPLIKVYISHTCKCTGWDIDSLYKKYPRYAKGARTNGYPREGDVQMLDWDFRNFQKHPDKVKTKHLQLAKEKSFDVIMSMDLWSSNWEESLKYTDELKKYCNRVLIPVHYFVEELKDYELALPNANWFASNVFPPSKEYRDNVTHILGGSPQSQIRLMTSKQKDLYGDGLVLKNVQSIDGNQIFNVAVRHGKYWFPRKPFWIKSEPQRPNVELFEMSLLNLHKTLELIET